MAHDALEGGNLTFELLDLGAARVHVLVVALLLLVKLADKSLDFHACLVVLLHERVVLEVNLLAFILVEIGIELVELIGKQELVVCDSEAVGACRGLVDSVCIAVVPDDEHHHEGDEADEDGCRRDYYGLELLVHNQLLN